MAEPLLAGIEYGEPLLLVSEHGNPFVEMILFLSKELLNGMRDYEGTRRNLHERNVFCLF